jgi:hypothetical protein
MNDLSQIGELSPISDAEASQYVPDRTHADLIAAITSTPAVSSGPKRARTRRMKVLAPMTRRWVVAAPVVLGIAGAVLIASLIGRPGEHVGAIHIGPAKAKAALAFTRHGHFIDVIVTNPYADQKKYDAEFKARGLKIKLELIAASPSLADTTVAFSGTGKLRWHQDDYQDRPVFHRRRGQQVPDRDPGAAQLQRVGRACIRPGGQARRAVRDHRFGVRAGRGTARPAHHRSPGRRVPRGDEDAACDRGCLPHLEARQR